MARWKGQTRGGVLGYRIFMAVIRWFGPTPAYLLLRFVTFYFFLFSGGSNRSAGFYFRRIHHRSPFQAYRSIYRNYLRFGETLVDKFALLSGVATDRYTYEHEGGAYLDQMMREGKGGVLISAHLGNWDVAGHLLERLEGRVNVVMYDGERQRMKATLEPVLGKRSFNIITIGEGMEHLIAINKALSAGEFICIHGDRYLEGARTVRATLKGGDVTLPVGPFIVATRFDAPVSFVYACKDSPRHYHFYSTPPENYKAVRGQKAEDAVRPVVEDYTRTLEKFMDRYPEQWFNFFPYWEEEKTKHS